MKLRGAFSAAAALLFVATAAQAQRGRDDRRGGQEQRQQAAPQPPGRPSGAWRGQAQQRDDRARNDQARAEQAGAEKARAERASADQARAAAEQNRLRAAQQNDQWRTQQNRQIQQDQIDRARQAQQEEQLERQQQLARDRQLEANRADERERTIHEYDGDVRLVPAYRYNIGGVYRETSQYGADLFRQAVDQGYDEGYRAGLNDRRDGAPADVRRALDFESGSFGYSGGYVPADDYSYYFGQGFQRGYDDGYWSRSTYGTFLNGKAAILGAVALGILGLTSLH